MTQVFFAPMEGITDAVFRRVHHDCFSGVETYFIPFISPNKNIVLSTREKHGVLPEYNAGVPCVPQVLTRDPEHFLWAARLLADFGYTEVNLNVGCPSSTVTAKGKGAGLLREPQALEQLLSAVCGQSPLPVSVKTRIGFQDPEEWPALLGVFAQYPLKRLIVHPRTCRERYLPGVIHRDCWQTACNYNPGELVCNGDLFSAAEVSTLLRENPGTAGVMLGRGLVANPALAREIHGGPGLTREEVISFHDRLALALQEVYPPNAVLMKLRDVTRHLACCFADTAKLEKQMGRCRTLSHLLDIDRRMFETCNFLENPFFIPEGLREP